MSDKKINLVFDVTLLILNRHKNAFRSGIYFTAVNVLDEFYKNPNIKMSFYCNKKLIPAIKETEFLKKYDCPIINFDDMSKDDWTYVHLKEKRNEYKQQKKSLQKNLLTIQQLLFSLKMKLFGNKKINLDKYKNCNVFFSPCYQLPPEIKTIKHLKKYTIIYDTIPLILPEYFDDVQRGNSWFLKMVKDTNKEDFYFSISEATKRDFIKYVPTIDPEHITTTLLACNEAFRPEPEKTKASLEKYNLPTDKKYIFSLCTLEPRKNLIRAAKTFIQFIEKHKINDLIFILGGGSWEGFIEKLEREVPDFDKYRDKIIKAGYIDDEDLAPLYSGAEWFVYTSQYEGFGLPPLEAMSCGCAVITSNNSSLPEVVGDAGIMIDWDNEEEHVQAYEKYYFNPEIRNEYAQKGLERAKQFSWKKCTDEMVKVMVKNENNENQN